MSASIVSSVDAAPVLDAAEHVFDFVALPVKQLVIIVLDFAVFERRDTGDDIAIDERRAKAVAVITLVADQHLDLREPIKQDGRAPMVADLACGKHQNEWPALAVADGVELGVQPAFGAADMSG